MTVNTMPATRADKATANGSIAAEKTSRVASAQPDFSLPPLTVGDGADDIADRAAPLDALLVQAARSPFRRFVPNASTAKFAAGLARHPVGAGRRFTDLAGELARVGTGTSGHRPRSRRDRRFTDNAWSENPLLRRLVQAYLATGQTVDQLVVDAKLSRRDQERVRFLVENIQQALAPSNVPLVNPASAKAVIDTAGPEPTAWRSEPAAGHGQCTKGSGDGGRLRRSRSAGTWQPPRARWSCAPRSWN